MRQLKTRVTNGALISRGWDAYFNLIWIENMQEFNLSLNTLLTWYSTWSNATSIVHLFLDQRFSLAIQNLPQRTITRAASASRSIRQIQSHVFLSVTVSTYGSRCIESWHKRQRNCNLPMPVSLTSYTVERMLRQRMQQYQYRFLYLQDFYAKWLLHVSLATLRNEGIHYRTPQRLRSWVASMHLRASVILIFSFVSTKV